MNATPHPTERTNKCGGGNHVKHGFCIECHESSEKKENPVTQRTTERTPSKEAVAKANEIIKEYSVFGNGGVSYTRETLKAIALALDAEREEIADLVDKYWKFDDNQRPYCSYHDKQECLEAIRRKP